MLTRIFLSLSLLIISTATLAESLHIKNVRVSSSTQRMVVEVDGDFQYRIFSLDDPERLVIDVLNATLDKHFKKPSFRHTPIKGLRTGIRHGKDIRLVFDLKTPIRRHAFMLKHKSHAPARLVIDWEQKHKAHARNSTTKKLLLPVTPVSPLTPKLPPEETIPKHLMPQKSRRSMSFRPMTIVIDPGHGGRDPGAIGRAGTREKNVVMSIGQQIKENLDKLYGVKVILTRHGDYFVPLRKRLDVARNNSADLFVSVHADAYQERSSNGASIYALSPSGASSEVARWIADRENYSELGGVDLNELQDSSDTLRTMLLDLSQTATISSSVRLGESLLKSLSRVVSLHKRKVEQAPFVVLKSPDIPSILIELGFISNQREERQLRSYIHQRKLAKAVSKGIFEFARKHAPIDTYFAQRYRKSTYELAQK